MLGNYAVYFIPRLLHFKTYLQEKGDELIIIEESDKNKLYGSFANDDKNSLKRYLISEVKEKKSYKEKVFSLLDRIRPDIIVSGFIAFPYGAVALKWAKKNNCAIIEYDDQRKDTFPKGWLSTFIKKCIIRNVDAFLCPTPAWDETLLSYGFRQADIFYGLDCSDNDFWGGKVTSFSFQNLPEKYFMTVGRQANMKNLHNFLLAYKTYLTEGGNIPLVMVGEGPQHESLKGIANNSPMIIFLPFQNKEKIRELFTRMKALILPSYKTETWGMVVNECMASGGIVGISSECGSATTLVKDQINGFHFSPYSKKEMTSILHKLENLTVKQESEMKAKSLDIIQNWGLDRFSTGLYDACCYALNHKKKVRNPIDLILIKLWKGRFNVDVATK